jgi:hypothetical protein
VNADAKHKLIRHYAVTDAAVHDSQELDGLLDEGNTCNDVFADSAYRSAEIEAKLRASGYKSRIHRRGRRNHPRSLAQQRANHAKSRIRARIEHVFGSQQSAPGGRIVRTIGMARARAKIGLQNLATFAAWSHWNGSPRHEGGGVVGSVPTEAGGGKREAVTTANQSKIGPNPNLCPIRRQNRPLFEVPY